MDYGALTGSNRDSETGIHYGVISQRSLNPDIIYDVMDEGADYGTPRCPKCGDEALENDHDDIPPTGERLDWTYKGTDYACVPCKYTFYSDEAFPDESLGWSYEKDSYWLTDCLDSDVFILDSPYYTYAPLCSPCVPGAGNLDDAHAYGSASPYAVQTYCLDHDWFESGKAPYLVIRVSDGSVVLPNV